MNKKIKVIIGVALIGLGAHICFTGYAENVKKTADVQDSGIDQEEEDLDKASKEKEEGFELHAEGPLTLVGLGYGVYWAYNKYLKTPLKHIHDDTWAAYRAINKLQERLQKTVNENGSKKWKSHSFEPERLDIIDAWSKAPEFAAFKKWLITCNDTIQAKK